MKIKIYESYGFAGTDTEYTEEIPQEIVEQGQDAIDDYIEEARNDLWANMISSLSLSVEIVE